MDAVEAPKTDKVTFALNEQHKQQVREFDAKLLEMKAAIGDLELQYINRKNTLFAMCDDNRKSLTKLLNAVACANGFVESPKAVLGLDTETMVLSWDAATKSDPAP